MPTSRHRHLMFHCYWFPCLSPQTLLYKCFSKGRTGWNRDSAESRSSQSRFFSAVVRRKREKKTISNYTGSGTPFSAEYRRGPSKRAKISQSCAFQTVMCKSITYRSFLKMQSPIQYVGFQMIYFYRFSGDDNDSENSSE